MRDRLTGWVTPDLKPTAIYPRSKIVEYVNDKENIVVKFYYSTEGWQCVVTVYGRNRKQRFFTTSQTVFFLN